VSEVTSHAQLHQQSSARMNKRYVVIFSFFFGELGVFGEIKAKHFGIIG
jgi:hypothetical protein